MKQSENTMYNATTYVLKRFMQHTNPPQKKQRYRLIQIDPNSSDDFGFLL
jgi:hypothetical protein